MKTPRPTTLQRLGEVEIAVALRLGQVEQRLVALEVLLRALEERCATALDTLVRDVQRLHTQQQELRQGTAELIEFLDYTPSTRKDN